MLARAIEALGRFPSDQSWVLVGGIAVFVRLGSVTRPTADADTVARSPAALIERRAFALARRFALQSATVEGVVVSHGGVIAIDARVPVATTSALVALKTVSMVRRPHGNSPHKVGSDIHDLVRLVTGAGASSVAAEIVADRRLGTWMADQVGRAFGGDLRYTLLRLRTNDRSVGAQALTDSEVEAIIVLADELRELLGPGRSP